MSGTRANPRKYDTSAFQNAKIHKLLVTVLFEEAWCSYRHFRFFLTIHYLFSTCLALNTQTKTFCQVQTSLKRRNWILALLTKFIIGQLVASLNDHRSF